MVFLVSSIVQKKRKKNQLYYYGTSSRIVFVHFLGELKIPKRHFEINLPLEGDQKLTHPPLFFQRFLWTSPYNIIHIMIF